MADATKTIESFLAALDRSLRFAVPRQKREEFVSEAEAHLRDCADDFVAGGMERSQAEAVAVAGFGPAKAYGRALVRSAYDDRFSVHSRQYAAILGGVLLTFALCLFENWLRTPNYLQSPFISNANGESMSRGGALYIVAMVLLAAFAACGRRSQTRLFTAIVAVGMVAGFVNGGVNWIASTEHFGQVSRWEIAEHRADPAYQVQMENDVRLLQMGGATYAVKGISEASIPAALRYNGGFIVPNVHLFASMGGCTEGALQSEPSSELFSRLPERDPNQIAYHALYRSMPYITVASATEARKAWRDAGSRWLEVRAGTLNDYKVREQRWATLQARELPSFDLAAAKNHAMMFGLFGLMIIFLQAIVAYISRKAMCLFSNHRGPRATTV